KRHYTFLSRQRLFSNSGNVSEEDKKKVVDRLKKKRYKITDENGYILAEKNRFSRWGPYVNHIGLIIVLLAALVRMSPIIFLDDYVWVREGEQKVHPRTDSEYLIEHKKFTLETYDAEDEEYEKFKDAIELQGMIELNYQTDVVICKAKDKEI